MGNLSIQHDAQGSYAKLIRGFAIAAVGLVLVLVAGVAYIWFSGGSGQPSSPLTAPSLSFQAGDTRTFFQLLSDESEARFIIDEMLFGAPKTVVGTTNQVAGDILVDFDNPDASQIGTIRINARTFATDNELRNRALRGQILRSDRDEFEFADFVPTELIGLPNTLTIGETISFQMQGNLIVHGVSREVTFDVELTPLDETRLEGTAKTTVRYADFDISIPEAPGVANVSDDVRLEIDFVALANSN